MRMFNSLLACLPEHGYLSVRNSDGCFFDECVGVYMQAMSEIRRV